MTGLADLAADAYLAGWALTDAPWTERVHVGLAAAVTVACEHADDPGVLEATMHLGQLEGVWATIYARRARLQAKHERAVLAAWKTATTGLDPADVVAVFRREAYLTSEAATKDPTKRWWQELGAAAALGWLRKLYAGDGYDALVTTLADAIRAGMAEGEANALAVAATQAGHVGFPIGKAFKAAYARLANDPAIGRKAADAATRLIDSTAGNVGRRLAKLAGDGSSEDDMTAGVADVVNDPQPVRQGAGDVFWTALGAAALSLFGRASKPPPGTSDSGGGVLVDWNSEPSACIICQDNTANGPYLPLDVPAYLAHPNCRCWLSAASGLPAWMLAGWLAGDD